MTFTGTATGVFIMFTATEESRKSKMKHKLGNRRIE